MEKTYNVYKQIGNFSELVFTSDNFYEVQDFSEDEKYNAGIDPENDSELALFYSYYYIDEV